MQGEKKRKVVHELHLKSQKWEKKGKHMETDEKFGLLLKEGDQIISVHVRNGYRHIELYWNIRKLILFRYYGRFFRCKIPFGWGRSAFLFPNLLKPLVRYIREEVGVSGLPYIDDLKSSIFGSTLNPPTDTTGSSCWSRGRGG